MATKKIAVVIGDIGATDELIPAAQDLQNRGFEVEWIAAQEGQGYTRLDAAQIPWTKQAARQRVNHFDLILIGTSATAVRDQQQWTMAGQEAGKNVLWYEDLWGTGERPATRLVDPHVMLVVDNTAAAIAHAVRPHIRTEVVGKPTFQYLQDLNETQIIAIRDKYRRQLNIPDEQCLVVYWGGGDLDRVLHQLSRLKTAIAKFHVSTAWRKKVNLAVRLHPKMPAVTPAATLFHQACQSPESPWLVDGSALEPAALNCAADCVVGEFGTTQTYAAALVGTKPIIALWPDNVAKRRECGFIDGIPPLIERNIAVGFTSEQALDVLLPVVLLTDVTQRQETFRAARQAFGEAIEPGAASRIADAVMKYLP